MINVNNGEKVTISNGLTYIDVIVGEGSAPKAGDMILAHYIGELENGSKFDSSVDRDEPLEFQVGVGQVIKGWDLGILGLESENMPAMKVGGKRILIIPSDLAYGNRAMGHLIPVNSTLVFEVSLVG
jgi:FKBP-type peptidyl-prolyl cis-trans isomerase